MTRPLDVLIHHMRASAGSSNAWESGFAKSILKQARKPWWHPSPKQKAIMQRIVSDAFDGGDLVVIEDD